MAIEQEYPEFVSLKEKQDRNGELILYNIRDPLENSRKLKNCVILLRRCYVYKFEYFGVFSHEYVYKFHKIAMYNVTPFALLSLDLRSDRD